MKPVVQRAAGVVLSALAPLSAWADYNSSTEAPSVGLAKQLLCGVVTVGTGKIALLAGLMLAIYGLWHMVRHGALKTGGIMVLGGALITALPSLVISTMDGVAHWLKASDISAYGDVSFARRVAALAGNCSSIPVDWSNYSTTRGPSFMDPFGTGSFGQAAAGTPDASGPMTPNAQTGSSGCTHLVSGGGPGSPFGPRKSVQTSNGRFSSANHKGVDITCGGRDGPAIKAASAGTAYIYTSGSYGNRVIIKHGSGNLTTYNHLSAYASGMQNGKQVGGNEVIGACGRTGNSTGAHLHFELKKDGVFVDPVANRCGG